MVIKAHTIIEIAGFPAKHITGAMDTVLKKLKEEKGINIIKKRVNKTKKVKEMWSTFAELELKFLDLSTLMGFCFDYLPSSIEIIDPAVLHTESKMLANNLNDMLAKLHQYTMFISNLNAENTMLKRRATITS